MYKKLITIAFSVIVLLCMFAITAFAEGTGTITSFDNLVIASEVLLNGNPPAGLTFKPGRILDNGMTVWFCGASGANKNTYVFRSIDGGETFTHNATPIEERAAQMDAFDANTALVATANGKIWKTDNGGVTWTEKYSYTINVIAPGWFDGLRVLNENVAVAFGDMEPNGLMHFVRTEDRGDTWTEITSVDYLNAAYAYYTWGLAACNIGESVWCTGETMEYDSAFVFRSYDAGVTWDSFRIPQDVIYKYPRAIAFSSDDNGLIADRNGNVIMSSDGGATWAKTNKPDVSADCWVNGVVAVPGTNIIFGLDDIGVFYTSDLGATWGKLPAPAETDTDDFIGALFLNKDFGFIFTYGGIVLRFENQIQNVQPPVFDNLVVASEVKLNGNPPAGLLFKPGRILDNGKTIWFCGASGANKNTYVFRSIDGGKTFTHNATPIEERAAQMDAFDANTALVATANGKIWKTDDGGVNWTEKYSYTINVIAPGWFDGLRVLNDNVAVAFGDMEPNGLMHFVRTEDRGETWTEITSVDYLNAAYAYYTWGLAACNIGESVWCTGETMEYDSAFVFRSYDAGVTWESFRIPQNVIYKYPRAIAFSSDDYGLIADRNGNVIMSSDGGATWAKTNKPDLVSADCWVNGVVTVPGTNIIFGLDDIGIFYTTNLGATWGKLTAPSETDTDDFTSALFLNKDFGFIFTYGGIVLRFENQISTDLPDQPDNIPGAFNLYQNYPNPFNPTTNISFYLPQAAHVKLAIYDLSGREVRTLINEQRAGGEHTLIWDGLNNSGKPAASGSYIYKLRSNEISLSKMMQLVR